MNIKFWQKKQAIPNLAAAEIKEEKIPSSSNKKKSLLIGLGGFLLVLFILGWFFAIQPLLKLKTAAQEGQQTINQLKQAFEEKNLPYIKEKIKELETTVAAGQKISRRLSWLKIIPTAKNYYQNSELILQAAAKSLEAGQETVTAITPYANMLGYQTDQKEEEKNEETTNDRIQFILKSSRDLSEKIDGIADKVHQTNQLVNQVDVNYLPEELRGIKIKERFTQLKKPLHQASQFLDGAKPLFENLPYFLGEKEIRKYLVIFQNDTEIRPSGGFLTAYAVLQIDKGEITPLLSKDIYDLDARFNSHLQAPRPIKKFLPQVYYWNLRDMNLSPDFKKSMETFYPHYQKVAQYPEVDAIIAVDTQLLADLLTVFGTVNVPGWGNFSAEADDRCYGCPQVVYALELLADKPTNVKRNDRKAVLGPLMRTILINIMGAPADKMSKLFQTVLTSLEEKHLLLYYPQEDKQEIFEKLNFAGRIKDFEGDYFHLNNTNFAGAKSNMFIKEEVKQTILPQKDGRIIKEVTVKYTNPSPASDCNLESGGLCLNGLYRDWFRFYVPKGSELIEMKGSETEAITYEELDKTVFEGFFGNKYPLYPDGGVTIVKLKYRLPFQYEKDKPYQLFIQKQPGAKNHSYSAVLNQVTKTIELNGDTTLEWQ